MTVSVKRNAKLTKAEELEAIKAIKKLQIELAIKGVKKGIYVF